MQQTFDKLRPDLLNSFLSEKDENIIRKHPESLMSVTKCHQEISNMAVSCAPFFVWQLDMLYKEKGGGVAN